MFVRIILWSEMNIQFTQCFPVSTLLLTFLRFSTYPILAYLGRLAPYPSAFIGCTFAADLFRSITPMTLPVSSLFFQHTSTILQFLRIDTVTALHIRDYDWHFSRKSHIVILFNECLIWFLMFCCPSSI